MAGFVGWLFWGFVHIYFLIGLRARFSVALDWLWSYVRSITFNQRRSPLTERREGRSAERRWASGG